MALMFERYSDEFLAISEAKGETDEALAFVKMVSGDRKPGLAVDLACGGGRFSGPLATWASEVLGIDASEPFIARAKANAAKFRNVDYVVGDMFALPELLGGKAADVIVRLYTSLGYFLPEREEQFLRACRASLASGGVLILDTFNAQAIRERRSWSSVTEAGGVRLLERYVFNEGRNCVDAAWVYDLADGPRVEIPFSLGYFEYASLKEMFARAGFNARFHDGFGAEIETGGAASQLRMTVVATPI